MSIHNQKRKKYSLNDFYFNEKSQQSAYFAGLLAADGCLISKGNSVTLGLKREDRYILEYFLKDIQGNHPIKDNLEKGKFLSSKIEIASYQVRQDLQNIYNLTTKKSLTLVPPNIETNDLVDSFICGYIDGDGSIFLSSPRNENSQKNIIISILGTKEMLEWILEKFKVVLNTDKLATIKQKRNNGKNTFVLTISNKIARSLFIHYYNLPIKKLERKWKSEYFDYCINFKRKGNNRNVTWKKKIQTTI